MDIDIQKQHDAISQFFKYTCEPYDTLEWDGSVLLVFLNDEPIETYTIQDMMEFGVIEEY